jgi:predicted nucleic acid-binding protein
MPRTIFLDSAPLSLLASSANTTEAQAIARWALDCDAAGHRIIIPEIVDYEVRRELLRAGKSRSVAELDNLKAVFTYLPVSTAAMRLAATLWAQVRQQGKPTANDQNIDVDVILAAQALTIGVPTADLVVATVNQRHLSLFVAADQWTNIAP